MGCIPPIVVRMAQLLTDIETFCSRHDIKPTRFGELALNDKPFVSQLRGEGRAKPRRVWPETEAKIRKFMEEYPAQSEAAQC